MPPQARKANNSNVKKESDAKKENSQESGELNVEMAIEDQQIKVISEGRLADLAAMDDETLLMGNNEIAAGIGCSEMAYYNVIMSGGRVTRNRIRKEEKPPPGGTPLTVNTITRSGSTVLAGPLPSLQSGVLPGDN